MLKRIIKTLWIQNPTKDIANYNTESQIIISGYKKHVDDLIMNSKKYNLRRVIQLNV